MLGIECGSSERGAIFLRFFSSSSSLQSSQWLLWGPVLCLASNGLGTECTGNPPCLSELSLPPRKNTGWCPRPWTLINVVLQQPSLVTCFILPHAHMELDSSSLLLISGNSSTCGVPGIPHSAGPLVPDSYFFLCCFSPKAKQTKNILFCPQDGVSLYSP